jgi:demethylmenaquinone methyltransferase/2-methoxy-6-polyprenyl-1,4-benzoquinol methylase
MTRAPVDSAIGPGSPPPADPYAAYIRSFFRRWAGIYDLFSGAVSWTYAAAVRRVDPRPGQDVLDLCTGTGSIALRCARRGARTVAVDLSEAMIDRARAKAEARSEPSSRLRFEIMDARRLLFPDRSFDVTVLSFALHDMPRRARLEVLREARRVTARRLVVLDYELPASALWRRLLLAPIAVFETAYFPRFAAEGLAPLLAEAGLERVTRRRLGPVFAVHTIELRAPAAP